MATAKATTDHDEIRKWVEARGGRPARVKATGRGKDPGILRIDFPGFSGEGSLEEIGWDEFFDWFDRNNLAMLLSGARGNRFNKLVERTAARGSSSRKSASKKGGARKAASKKPSAKKSAKKTTSKKSAAKKSAASTKSASKKSAASTKSASKKSASRKSASKKSASTKSSPRKASAKKATAAKSASKKTSSTKKSAAKRTTAGATSKRSTSGGSKSTTSHATIRRWVEARGGFPATVAGTEGRGEEAGLLRIDYPGFSGEGSLERIDWDAWFEKFDDEKLKFLYQDKKNSRFSKLVRR